jgi:hypothetical protein
MNTQRLKHDAVLIPDGAQYERLTVLLIDLVQRLRAQVDALVARVAVVAGRSG